MSRLTAALIIAAALVIGMFGAVILFVYLVGETLQHMR